MLDVVAATTATSMLTPAHFESPRNAMIFDAIGHLVRENKAIDFLVLCNELESRKHLEKIGGEAYLAEILDSQNSAAGIESICEIVIEKAVRRGVLALAGVLTEKSQNGCDVRELVEYASDSLLELPRLQQETPFVSVESIMPRVIEDLEARISKSREISGIPSGLHEFDKWTMGFQKGDFAIIAARPSCGKSALMLQAAIYAAELGHRIAITSLEMSKEALMLRATAMVAKVDANLVRRGGASSSEIENLSWATEKLSKLPIVIDDRTGLTFHQIRSKIRRLIVETGPIDAFFLDYVQLVESTGLEESRQQEVAKISRGLQSLARQMNIAVVGMCQLKRPPQGSEGRRPYLSDLKESGALEQDADLVVLLHRPEVADPRKAKDEHQQRIAEFTVAKQRNGPTGFFNMAFVPHYTRFEILARKEENG